MHACKLLKQVVKCHGALSFRSVHQKSVAQATVEKGHTGWDTEVRPVYMDAQVIFCLRNKEP